MKYKNQFNAALNKALKMEPFVTGNYRPPRFRLSASPFCAYKFLFQWYDFIKTDKIDLWDYSSDFYTSIGTTIHSLLQKWIPINNPGLFLGNWKCPTCKKVIEAATGPKFCKKCQSWMIYEEFVFYEKPGFAGHGDGIYLLNTDLVKTLDIDLYNTKRMDKYIRSCKKPVEAIALEFKSAGSFKAKRLGGPTPRNKAQALMYVPCANRKLKELGLNVNVIGAMVKYLSRDNPNSSSNDFFLPVKDESLFDYSKGIVRSVYKAVKTGEVSHIYDSGIPCKGRFRDLYDECDYRESCSSLRKEAKIFLKETRKEIKRDFIFLQNLEER